MKATKTLELIDEKIKQLHNEKEREHLGASEIGDGCLLKCWFSFRKVLTPDFSARLLRIFSRGHEEEKRFVKYLKQIGIHCINTENDQMRFSRFGGHFAGSPDGFALHVPEVPQGKWCLLEFKTSNDANFNNLKKNGVEDAKPQHFAQMQVYMGEFGVEHALYLVVNKDNDELYGEIVTFDHGEYEKHLKNAEDVIFSTEPPKPISKKKAFWRCQMCDFYKVCKFGEEIEKKCRSCKHAQPTVLGEWTCKNTFGNVCKDWEPCYKLEKEKENEKWF